MHAFLVPHILLRPQWNYYNNLMSAKAPNIFYKLPGIHSEHRTLEELCLHFQQLMPNGDRIRA